MHLSSCGEQISGDSYDAEVKGNLIPVGGGKDSFVTLDVLAPYKKIVHLSLTQLFLQSTLHMRLGTKKEKI